MFDRVLVEISPGAHYAPCAYLYRIVNERDHRRAMAAVAENGGPVPEDDREDNVLIQGEADDLYEGYVSPRRAREIRRDLEGGWSVRFLLDRWTAFAYYGYDASKAA